jgi:hypothetical protein
MHRSTSLNRSFAVLIPLLGSMANAEDLKLTDGSLLRQVRVVEVRPDALVVSHQNGVAMASYEKLPRAVRTHYGLNARDAAAYRERETAVRQGVAEENRRLAADYEQRKIARARTQMEGVDRGVSPSGLTYRQGGDRSYDNAVEYVEKEIARAEEQRIEEARKADTFWTAPFWKNPIVKLLGAFFGGGGAAGGFNSEPRNWH